MELVGGEVREVRPRQAHEQEERRVGLRAGGDVVDRRVGHLVVDLAAVGEVVGVQLTRRRVRFASPRGSGSCFALRTAAGPWVREMLSP